MYLNIHTYNGKHCKLAEAGDEDVYEVVEFWMQTQMEQLRDWNIHVRHAVLADDPDLVAFATWQIPSLNMKLQ